MHRLVFCGLVLEVTCTAKNRRPTGTHGPTTTTPPIPTTVGETHSEGPNSRYVDARHHQRKCALRRGSSNTIVANVQAEFRFNGRFLIGLRNVLV